MQMDNFTIFIWTLTPNMDGNKAKLFSGRDRHFFLFIRRRINIPLVSFNKIKIFSSNSQDEH